jgi:hypothetical protein
LASDPGFECIELMLEVRKRFLQNSQFFRAGISIHRVLPIRCSEQQVEQPKLRRMGFLISRGDERLDPQAIHCPAVLEYVPDPDCVKTFFRLQKLHATGDDLRRHDDLSVFLLYRVWSQPGRNLGLR